MPRTIAAECPGCPPIRALTFDVLGLIKVIEARSTTTSGAGLPTTPHVVQRWGEPDASRSILSASIDDSKFNPLLALARKNGHIELLNPLNGDVRASVVTENAVEEPIVGLHLFKKKELKESSSRTRTLFTCTSKGNAALRSIQVADTPEDSVSSESATWSVCGSGDILCSAVNGSESHALFAGKGVEVNLWDLEKRSKLWTAKPPKKDSLGIYVPTWFTSATFPSKEDHRTIVAGTNNHQVRLYDLSAQRRPVMCHDFREAPIKAVTADLDGYTIYFGTGSGDLASVDIRTGKLLGCFLGKCSGSIRSIVRHPELPLIVSCGLDRYLRFWDVKTRQLLSAVFLKQHLTNVVIDSNFSNEVTAGTAMISAVEGSVNQNNYEEADDAPPPVKRKKDSKDGEPKKKSKKKSRTVEVEDVHALVDQDESDDASEPVVDHDVQKKAALKEGKKNKSKKKSKKIVQEEDDNKVQVSHINDWEDDALPTYTVKEGEHSQKLNSKKRRKKAVEAEDD